MNSTKCIHLPIRISGTGYLLDDSGLVMAYCSDGIPCAEMKELVSIANSHAELLEALEELLHHGLVEEGRMGSRSFNELVDKAHAAIAKARN